jgi:integrase/recombinase XerD
VDIITNYKNYLKARRLAVSTQKTYTSEFTAFLIYFRGEDYRYISKDRIIEYLARLYDLGYSPSKVNQAINAIKFYKEKVLHQQRQTYFLMRPKRKKFMPNILPQEVMFKALNAPRNLKHTALLHFIYDNGLRISECRNMLLANLSTHGKTPYITVRETKHDGGRVIGLSENTLILLKRYYAVYKPQEYLFEGSAKGQQISKTTIRNILNAALKKVGVEGRFRVHDLRHNFATHCLENGTNIYHLSKILGHKSVQTTEKYYAHLLPENVVINRPEQPKQTKVIQFRKSA